MKPRILFTIVLVLGLSLTLATAQTKNDCTAKSASEKSSCCMKGAKMTMATDSKATTNANATIIQAGYTPDDAKAAHCAMSAKECLAKDAKHTGECTAAEKAQCEKMMKASMAKGGAKDCCKAKATEAKADVKKGAQEKTSDGKGTN